MLMLDSQAAASQSSVHGYVIYVPARIHTRRPVYRSNRWHIPSLWWSLRSVPPGATMRPFHQTSSHVPCTTHLLPQTAHTTCVFVQACIVSTQFTLDIFSRMYACRKRLACWREKKELALCLQGVWKCLGKHVGSGVWHPRGISPALVFHSYFKF